MNKVTLMGNLTKDPEIRNTAGGTVVVKFNLAVNRRFTKDGVKEADFINCTAFGKTAEFITKYFQKGKQMSLFGRINTGSYEKEGKKVFTTDVIVEDVYFTGNKNDSGQQSAPAQNPVKQQSAPKTESNPNPAPVYEDDELPF